MIYRTWTANSARSPASIKITQAPDPFLVSPRNTWLPSSIRVRISTKIIPLAVPHYYIPQAEIFNDSRSVRNTFVPSRFYPSTPFLPFLATRDRGYPPAFLQGPAMRFPTKETRGQFQFSTSILYITLQRLIFDSAEKRIGGSDRRLGGSIETRF